MKDPCCDRRSLTIADRDGEILNEPACRDSWVSLRSPGLIYGSALDSPGDLATA